MKLSVKRGKVSAGCRGLSTDSCFVFFHSQIQEEIDEPLPPVTSPHLHTHQKQIISLNKNQNNRQTRVRDFSFSFFLLFLFIRLRN
ncbi:hypothetical protein LR48_Vigan01g268600 [Vigna angularis]|uniref:Uncharacterized protein n=1 Tax=Phaseolus angularis TaxID=3914 RepID=A0A0L9TRG1_PHAAN|nr:hypothetical protein LR48_Vigan01g268600 [Vigna angularis]